MTAATGTGRTFGYRAHLDGLRAVAVYLVVLFHAGVGRASGGFVGVDLFFVLSGYLVTHVALAEVAESGSLSLSRFYARRVRRLLPAAAVVLLSTAAMVAAVQSPVEAQSYEDSFRAAFLYVANWHFVSASSDYFAATLDTNPVLHFWSLAIEEQFYLVWPAALVGIAYIGRRFRRGAVWVRALLGVAIVASAGWAVHLATIDVDRAYYGTDARAYQLLAGALLAMVGGRVSMGGTRRVRVGASALSGGALLMLLVLATSFIHVGPITRGLLVTIVTLAVLVGLDAVGPRDPTRRLLSSEPVRYLGAISYGTYLWHWPVVVFLRLAFDLDPAPTAIVTVLVASGLASLSHRLLEQPIRLSPLLHRIPRTVAVGGVTASVLIGVLIVPGVLDTGSAGTIVVTPAADADGRSDPALRPEQVDWRSVVPAVGQRHGCFGRPVDDCTLRRGDAAHVLLVGDSHGVMMRPALEDIAERRGLTLSMFAGLGCSWQLGLGQTGREHCFETQRDLYERVIPQLKPDVVVMIQRAVDDSDRPLRFIAQDLPADSSQAEIVEGTARRTIDALADLDQRAVIIDSVPVVADERDPLKCLAAGRPAEACRYVARSGPTALERLIEDRSGADLKRVDIDRLVCPYFPICDPVVDGTIVKWDSTHLTPEFALAIAPDVEAALDLVGAFEPRD